jgi:hypothetical protein
MGKITFNQGCYFNCHSPEYLNQFEEQGTLGIGMIHRNNPDQVENMLKLFNTLFDQKRKSNI